MNTFNFNKITNVEDTHAKQMLQLRIALFINNNPFNISSI